MSLLLLSLLLLASAVIGIGGSYINAGFNDFKSAWRTFDAVRSEEARLESRLRASLGYGGMIHDFKNYVLRQNPNYLIAGNKHLNEARVVLLQYQKLSLSKAVQAALQDLSITLDAYERGLQVAAALAAEGQNAQAIDRAVKVDDSLAFGALKVLRGLSTEDALTNEALDSKAMLVGQLRAALGYGGMIHHFKNYVLRQQSFYVEACIESYGHARSLLQLYGKLSPTPGEAEALREIALTIDRYADGLQTKTVLSASGIPPEELDKAVRVDDTRALRALNILDSEVLGDLKRRSQDIDATINRVEVVSHTLLWGGIVVLVLLALFSYVILRGNFLLPLQRLSGSMKELGGGNLGVFIADTEVANEIGDMARSVQTFQQSMSHVKEIEDLLNRNNEEMNTQLDRMRELKAKSDAQAAKALDLAESLSLARQKAEDASERAEADETRIRTILNAVSDAIVTIDDKGLIETFSPAAQAMFGYSEEEIKGTNVSRLMPKSAAVEHDGRIAAFLDGKGAGRMGKRADLTAVRIDDSEFPIEATIRMTRIGGKVKFIGVLRDITEQKAAQEEIQRLAMTDQLTGLANRNKFHQRFDEHLALAARENQMLALVLLDLDKFKPVNDTFGHPVGDALLQAVACILTKHSRETDVVARLGGDEFAILMVHPQDRDVVAKSAQRIVDAIREPLNVMGHPIQIGTSLGIALYPGDAEDEESLILQADSALYAAKEAGRNTYRFCTPDSETTPDPK
ncbi:diguanylate cyclase domain-containing protein [Magnetospira thiophila]